MRARRACPAGGNRLNGGAYPGSWPTSASSPRKIDTFVGTAERGFRPGKPGRRYLPIGQQFVADSLRARRRGCCQRCSGSAGHGAVLAGRGSWPHGRTLGRGFRAARGNCQANRTTAKSSRPCRRIARLPRRELSGLTIPSLRSPGRQPRMPSPLELDGAEMFGETSRAYARSGFPLQR